MRKVSKAFPGVKNKDFLSVYARPYIKSKQTSFDLFFNVTYKQRNVPSFSVLKTEKTEFEFSVLKTEETEFGRRCMTPNDPPFGIYIALWSDTM